MEFTYFMILIAFTIVANTENCGGNCPANNCPFCPCGSTKSLQDIAKFCSYENWDQNCCKCIISH